MVALNPYGPCQVAGHQKLIFQNASTVVVLCVLSFRYEHICLYKLSIFMVLSSTQPNSCDSQVCSVCFLYGFGLGESFSVPFVGMASW